jgi:glutamate-ammonia-ligase adenylyltransferase
MSDSTANPPAAAPALPVAAASGDGRDLLEVARRHSRYIATLIGAEPQLALEADLARPFSREAMHAFLSANEFANSAALHARLRALRKRVMLCLIARDLGGAADLAEVVATTTALADEAIACAAAWECVRVRSQRVTPASSARAAGASASAATAAMNRFFMMALLLVWGDGTSGRSGRARF